MVPITSSIADVCDDGDHRAGHEARAHRRHHVMVMHHGVTRAASVHQDRKQHQARAMRRGHQKRPQRELDRVDAHRDPSRMRARPDESGRCRTRSARRRRRSGKSGSNDGHPRPPINATTTAIETRCPNAIGTSAAEDLARGGCSCSPSATANSHPIEGSRP